MIVCSAMILSRVSIITKELGLVEHEIPKQHLSSSVIEIIDLGGNSLSSSLGIFR